MGIDVFGLITDWDEIVKAYRDAGGFGFYWKANLEINAEIAEAGPPYPEQSDVLPYAIERDLPMGKWFPYSWWYYNALRSHLPVDLRDAADGFLLMLYPLDDAPPHDLAVDAGVAQTSGLPYAMRPATVRAALGRDHLVPWKKLKAVADRVETEIGDSVIPDFSHFENTVGWQRNWLREAAAADRGFVLAISQ